MIISYNVKPKILRFKAKGEHLGRQQLNLSTISKQQGQTLEKAIRNGKGKRVHVLSLWKC